MMKLPPVEGEYIPQWDMKKLRARKCIVCGSSSVHLLCERPDRLSVAACRRCRAIYVPSVPGKQELEKLYSEYSKNKAYLSPRESNVPESFAFRLKRSTLHFLKLSSIGRRLHAAIVRKRPLPVSFIGELLLRSGGVDGRVVAEIGPSGNGGILPEMKLWGARCFAVEVDEGALRQMNERGIASVRQIDSLPEPADIVYASMVLEHLFDPMAFLTTVARYTAQDARIVLTVPNAGQSLDVGEHWIGFRVDLEHLNYFTSKSLSSLLVKAGFHPECIWRDSQPVLPQFLPMADRFAFEVAATSMQGRQIVLGADNPLGLRGDFSLTVLARKVHKER